MDKYQQYRKDNGLCIACGDPTNNGKTRCDMCLKIIATRQKDRYHNDPEYRKRKLEYQRQWVEKNPEKMAVYRERKYTYNRKPTGDEV